MLPRRGVVTVWAYATVTGIVSADGIGTELWEYIHGFHYAETSAVLIIIILTATVIDMISQAPRQRFT